MSEQTVFGKSAIPADTLTPLREGTRHFRVESTAREDLKIASDGQFYNLAIGRDAVTPDDTTYFLLITGDKSLIIEDLLNDMLETTSTEGTIRYDLNAYVQTSDLSDFTIDNPGTLLDVASSLNTNFINQRPTTELYGFSTISNITGIPTWKLVRQDMLVTSQGNNKTRDAVATQFFEEGRKIVIGPNTTVLFEAITQANTIGDTQVNLFTQLFFSEYEV